MPPVKRKFSTILYFFTVIAYAYCRFKISVSGTNVMLSGETHEAQTILVNIFLKWKNIFSICWVGTLPCL